MEQHERQRWMGLLARADEAFLSTLLDKIDAVPDYEFLRKPETGLVMVRGRSGGSGNAFNLGEMTITRCSVRTSDGDLGHAYIQGRRPDHAERAAVMDALLQDTAHRNRLMEQIVDSLEKQEEERRKTKTQESAATKVDFFTLIRGEDE